MPSLLFCGFGLLRRLLQKMHEILPGILAAASSITSCATRTVTAVSCIGTFFAPLSKGFC